MLYLFINATNYLTCFNKITIKIPLRNLNGTIENLAQV